MNSLFLQLLDAPGRLSLGGDGSESAAAGDGDDENDQPLLKLRASHAGRFLDSEKANCDEEIPGPTNSNSVEESSIESSSVV